MRLLGFVLALMLGCGAAWALDPATTGVVVLHGKWGNPSGVRPIGDALEAAGYTVVRPAMPWAGYRSYDKSYDGAMEEVAQAVAGLRAKGLRQVVVAGHSLGGNGALHFATLDAGLAAIVLVAPAHLPEGAKTVEQVAASVATARAMVAAGNGGDSAAFLDVNSGDRTRMQRIPANIYLSYYAPEGPAAMSLSAPDLKVGRIAWLAPADDPVSRIFATLVVPHLPATTRLDRIDIAGGHLDAPEAAASAIVQWLNALSPPGE